MPLVSLLRSADMADAIDFGTAERMLETAEFLDSRPIWASSNVVSLARMCHATRGEFAAIYKPRGGERPLWDFPDGTLYRREVAAYRLSRLLGWPLIPPTVAREGPQGIGSVQLYIAHDPASHYFTQREVPDLLPQVQRMAVFDYVANNADRKGGHCLLDEEGRVWGIDHGLCFHVEYKMRTVIWDWSEEAIPAEWLAELEAAGLRLAGEGKGEGETSFAGLLDLDEVSGILRRIDQLLASKRFPAPGPHRSYPWPLV